MFMKEVSSSRISAVGYSDGILRIRFHKGGTYDYYDVPEHIYKELMSAFSLGEYFSDNIRKIYRFKKISQ